MLFNIGFDEQFFFSSMLLSRSLFACLRLLEQSEAIPQTALPEEKIYLANTFNFFKNSIVQRKVGQERKIHDNLLHFVNSYLRNVLQMHDEGNMQTNKEWIQIFGISLSNVTLTLKRKDSL